MVTRYCLAQKTRKSEKYNIQINEISLGPVNSSLLEEIIGDAVVEGKGDAVVDLHLLGQGVDVDRPHVGPHRRHPPAIAAGGDPDSVFASAAGLRT